MASSTVKIAKQDSSGLRPAVGTKLTGGGIVTFHDVTRHGLHRTRVELSDGYPPLTAWCEMVKGRLLRHDYSERIDHGFVGILWLYWKEHEHGQMD